MCSRGLVASPVERNVQGSSPLAPVLDLDHSTRASGRYRPWSGSFAAIPLQARAHALREKLDATRRRLRRTPLRNAHPLKRAQSNATHGVPAPLLNVTPFGSDSTVSFHARREVAAAARSITRPTIRRTSGSRPGDLPHCPRAHATTYARTAVASCAAFLAVR